MTPGGRRAVARHDSSRPDSSWRAAAYDRYRAASGLPLLLLAVALVPLLVGPLVVDTSPAVDAWLTAVDWLVWAAFAADYLIGLGLTPDRRRYVRTEWPNLLLVVLPFLRPLRLLRSTRALRLLRLARVGAALSEAGAGGPAAARPPPPALRAAGHSGPRDRRRAGHGRRGVRRAGSDRGLP